jgi:hypothetical protein
MVDYSVDHPTNNTIQHKKLGKINCYLDLFHHKGVFIRLHGLPSQDGTHQGRSKANPMDARPVVCTHFAFCHQSRILLPKQKATNRLGKQRPKPLFSTRSLLLKSEPFQLRPAQQEPADCMISFVLSCGRLYPFFFFSALSWAVVALALGCSLLAHAIIFR